MRTFTSAKGFDFHCHVDLFPDPTALIAACDKARVTTLAVTTTPRAWRQNQAWTRKSRHVIAALGLHPELAGERHAEIDLLEQAMRETRFVGEIGLDGTPPHRKSWNAQLRVFTRALSTAERLGGRVLSIHSRRAGAEVLKALAENTTPERVLPILHWFSDSIRHAAEASRMGCYFSLNLPMLNSESGLALVRTLPPDRLLTETDAPFTNVPGDGHAGMVNETVRKLAHARGLGVDETLRTIAENANRVLAFGDMD
jgi:TatD DNase family protein